MKVILQRDIAKLGKRGEVTEVAEGYAINVLIKKGDAVHATPSELAKWKNKETQAKLKKDSAAATFANLVATLRITPVVITGKKHDEKKQLFASIKETEIADAIFTITKVSVDPKQIILASPIKSLGTYAAQIKSGTTLEHISVEVK